MSHAAAARRGMAHPLRATLLQAASVTSATGRPSATHVKSAADTVGTTVNRAGTLCWPVIGEALLGLFIIYFWRAVISQLDNYARAKPTSLSILDSIIYIYIFLSNTQALVYIVY